MKPAALFATTSLLLVLAASAALSFPPAGSAGAPGAAPGHGAPAGHATPLPRTEALPDSNDKGPWHVPIEVLIQSLADAESVQVGRVAVIWRDTVLADGTKQPFPYTQRLKMARADKSWLRRFSAAMFDTSTKLSDILPPLPSQGDDGDQPWVTTVIWFSTKSRGQTYLNFFQGCGFAGVGGRQPGGFWIDQQGDTLLGLMTEALPSDTVIAKLRAKRKGIAYVAPVEERLPAYGENVRVDELPEAITKYPPAYPDEARSKGVQGTVLVSALVGRDGKVKDMHLEKGVEGLDEAALSAVRKWTFAPAKVAGKPVAVWVTVPVQFSLK